MPGIVLEEAIRFREGQATTFMPCFQPKRRAQPKVVGLLGLKGTHREKREELGKAVLRG